ncbi:MAG: hypothetical protein Q9227_007047, partial [Pyrenula ochraceoflavens]
ENIDERSLTGSTDLLIRIERLLTPYSEWTVHVHCNSDHLAEDDNGVYDPTLQSKDKAGKACPVYVSNHYNSLDFAKLCDHTQTFLGHVEGILAEVHQGQFNAAKQARMILCPGWLDAILNYKPTSFSSAFGLALSGDLRWSEDIINNGLNSFMTFNSLNGIRSPEYTIVHELIHIFGDIIDPRTRKYTSGWQYLVPSRIDSNCVMAECKIRDGDPDIPGDGYDYSFSAARRRKQNVFTQYGALQTAVNYEFLVKGLSLQLLANDMTLPPNQRLRVNWPSYWHFGILDRQTMWPPPTIAQALQMYDDEAAKANSPSYREISRAMGSSWGKWKGKWGWKTSGGKNIPGAPGSVQGPA